MRSTDLGIFRALNATWSSCWNNMCDYVFWARFSLLGIKGNCQLKTRKVFLKALDLLTRENLIDEEKRILSSSLSALTDDCEGALIWLRNSKVKPKGSKPKLNLKNLMLDFKYLNSIEKTEHFELLLNQIDGLVGNPNALQRSDLNLRSLIACLTGLGKVLISLNVNFPDLNVESPLKSKIEKWKPYVEKSKIALSALRTSEVWNNRMIIFNSSLGLSSLDPHYDKKSSDQTNPFSFDYLHASIVHKDSNEAFSVWEMDFDKHAHGILSDQAMLTSEILQVEARNLIKPQFIPALIEELEIDNPELLYKILDRAFELTLKENNEKAHDLQLRSSNFTRWRSPFHAFWRSEGSMNKGSDLYKGQHAHCCHYVASILHNDVEEVNQHLMNLLSTSDRVLLPVINTRRLPSGFNPNSLLNELKKVCSVVQTNINLPHFS